jgi:hypothetical protein
MDLFVLGAFLKLVELSGELKERVGTQGVWASVILAIVEGNKGDDSARWQSDIGDIGVSDYLILVFQKWCESLHYLPL